MVRKIIHIDEEKCNGCGACARACHEGAIGIVDGKAKLLRDDYCDGFGDCLPTCPTGAITFTEREAAEYDEKAVMEHKRAMPPKHVCPGEMMHSFARMEWHAPSSHVPAESQLAQWPCQIKLVPLNAPFFLGASLLIAADCTAYAYSRMHDDFMRGKTTIIGCPKLDAVDYSEKFSGIFKGNDIRSIQVVRMEVPCCGGIEMAAKRALRASGKDIPLSVVTISIDGKIIG